MCFQFFSDSNIIQYNVGYLMLVGFSKIVIIVNNYSK